ncbi:hypothetical protein BIW11_11050 [Tropilaelaps mercedesae]|uniref:Uncharacterized protein n=1 Tax=Tropilaelaps mercedesae TaxID=418985 RepID=A0A1V9XCX3_9ACAR|nr:hypothetical protein BIW11_11050 [Tropilaelaps mercedesae]
MAPISCTPSKHELLGAAIVTLVMMASCSSSYAESDWAERRWEARFDACETADSYVFIKSPDDQECAVLCGRIPTPKVIPLANGSICKTNKGEPGAIARATVASVLLVKSHKWSKESTNEQYPLDLDEGLGQGGLLTLESSY